MVEYKCDKLKFKQLLYLLFRRKKCPNCGGKLTKKEEIMCTDNNNYTIFRSDGTIIHNSPKYRKSLGMHCKLCNKQFGLTELTGR